MAGGSVGTIYAELDLDASRFTKGQQKLLQDATRTTLDIESNFKNLGVKSSAEMDLMRAKIQNSYDRIKNSAQVTANDITRAEEAKNTKLKALNDQQYGAHTSMLSKLKANWIATSAAIVGAWMLVSKAWNIAEQAANFEQQKVAFDNLAASYGSSGNKIIASLQKISGGTIGMITLVEKAGTAMMMGINPEKISKLMEIARATSKMTGQSVTEAFDNISLAVGRQSKMVLDNLGIIVSAGDANEKYAAILGKTADQLTDAEKKTAFLNATIDAGEDLMRRMGTQQDTTRDKMDRLKATLSDMQIVLGQGLIRATAGAAAAFYALTVAANLTLGSILGIAGGFLRLQSILTFGDFSKSLKRASDELFEMANVAFKQAKIQGDRAADSFEAMIATTDELSGATKRTTNTFAAEAQVVGDITKKMEALIPLTAKWMEERLKYSKSDYTEALKKEGATIEGMRGSLNSYLATLRSVYTARIEGENAIAEAIKKSGGKPEEVAKAQIEALKQEKAYLEERQGGWKQYYDNLTSLQSKAIESQKAKVKELAALENAIAAQRLSHDSQMLALQEKLLIAQGKAATDETIYNAKLMAIEQERDAANRLSGDEQVKALESVKRKYGELTNVVTTAGTKFDYQTGRWVEDLKVVVTQEEAIKKAIQSVAEVQRQIEQSQEAARIAKQAEIETNKVWLADLEATIASAKTIMDGYTSKVIELSDTIAKIEREVIVTVGVNDKITPAIDGIMQKLDKLKSVQINFNADVRTGGSGGSGSGYPGGLLYDTRYATGGGGGSLAGSTLWKGTSNDMPSDNPSWWGNASTVTDGYTPTYTGGYTPDYSEPGYAIAPTGDTGYGGTEGGYASGLPYVPRDNFKARLHEGEAVLTKEEAELWRKGKGGQVINFNPNVNIVGANKSPEQLAREIVKPLEREMRRLATVN